MSCTLTDIPERSHWTALSLFQKGAVPITSFQAHDDRMYGIDWDRRSRHEIVTCSLGEDTVDASRSIVLKTQSR